MGLKNVIPRLDCLGLIEAHTWEMLSARSMTIPRLDCLGLIEASEAKMRSIGKPVVDSEA